MKKVNDLAISLSALFSKKCDSCIVLKDFKVEPFESFYTRAVLYYIFKTGIEKVTTFKEIDDLKNLVLIEMEKEPKISDKIKDKVIDNYFNELIIELKKQQYEALDPTEKTNNREVVEKISKDTNVIMENSSLSSDVYNHGNDNMKMERVQKIKGKM